MKNQVNTPVSQSDEPPAQEGIFKGMFKGTRGTGNILGLTSIGFVVTLIAVAAYFDEPTEAPDDPGHAGFLKEQYSQAIQKALESAGKVDYEMPAHFIKSADLLQKHTDTKAEIQNIIAGGNRSSDVQTQMKKNTSRLADAYKSFTSWDGGLVLSAMQCEAEDENTFSCDMTRMEIGGFDNSTHQMGGCSKSFENFAVKTDAEGQIADITTAGQGRVSSITFDEYDFPEAGLVGAFNNVITWKMGHSLSAKVSADALKFQNAIAAFSMCYDYDH